MSKTRTRRRSLLGRQGQLRPLLIGLLVVLSLGLGWGGDQLLKAPQLDWVGEGSGAALAQTSPKPSPTMSLPKPSLPGTSNPVTSNPVTSNPGIGTVDVVPTALQLGEQTYFQRCGTCHLAVPPQVLPLQTWQEMLPDSQHYGLQINPLRNPDLALVWSYIRNYARPLNPEESPPYRVGRSRYFRILHPDVKFPQPVILGSCVTCHPGAAKYNFRQLSAEWQSSP